MNPFSGGEGRPFVAPYQTATETTQLPGGRFDFDDGGQYCGGWKEQKATGHGICTGPRNQGEYAGSWHLGFEVSGCYTWPSGNTFSGQWQNGKRHGLGVETRGRWIYRGEWTQGLKGRYGTRCSLTSGAKYEGTFSNGMQDGYGTETYADGGTFQGQWLRGLRHGYGIRVSAPFSAASVQRKKSLHSQPIPESEALMSDEELDPGAERDAKIDSNRGGFVLKSQSDAPTVEQKRKTFAERKDQMKNSIISGLRLRKQKSTGDIDQKGANHTSAGSLRSARSNSSFGSSAESAGLASAASETNISFISQEEILDPNVTESYLGEWKNDKRTGFGVAERSDGLKYEGEWHNNRKYGYGVTYFRDGTKEEGKYKHNVLVSSQKKKATFMVRASKLREKIDHAVSSAQRAGQIALQKADISMNRTATARGKAEQAEIAAMNAKEDAEIGRVYAQQFSGTLYSPELRMGDRSNLPYNPVGNHVDSAVHQRVQSLYGRRNVNPEVRVDYNSNQVLDEEVPAGIAARVGGRLTVDDSYFVNPDGSRRPSIQHLGDEDFAPEQFLNRSSPRNLSVRGSVRSRRSNRNPIELGLQPQVHHASSSNILSQRRSEIGTTSVMAATVMEMPPGNNMVPGRSLPLPQPELRHTESGSPYYIATPNPAVLTPLMSSQIGTPEYMQQVAAKLQQNQRLSHTQSVQVDSQQTYQMYRPTPVAQPVIRRSTLPIIVNDPMHNGGPPKPPRIPTGQMPGIQEAKSGSIAGSETRGLHRSPTDSAMSTTMSRSSNPKLTHQTSQDARPRPESSMSKGSLMIPPRAPMLGKTPKIGSINMGSSMRVSMPDIFAAVNGDVALPLSREEVSRLSSERREAVRKRREADERIRRNPLLYLFHPALREWFYRHYLSVFVVCINVVLVFMFMNLLYGD